MTMPDPYLNAAVPVADATAAAHLGQMALIFDAPEGPDRALAAAAYMAQLDEWRSEAIAVRDVEVWRLARLGWGPAQVGRMMGLSKQRGDQLLRRVAESHAAAQQVVSRLRRRVNAERRAGADLTVVEDD